MEFTQTHGYSSVSLYVYRFVGTRGWQIDGERGYAIRNRGASSATSGHELLNRCLQVAIGLGQIGRCFLLLGVSAVRVVPLIDGDIHELKEASWATPWRCVHRAYWLQDPTWQRSASSRKAQTEEEVP
jgi:hypothetical protein